LARDIAAPLLRLLHVLRPQQGVLRAAACVHAAGRLRAAAKHEQSRVSRQAGVTELDAVHACRCVALLRLACWCGGSSSICCAEAFAACIAAARSAADAASVGAPRQPNSNTPQPLAWRMMWLCCTCMLPRGAHPAADRVLTPLEAWMVDSMMLALLRDPGVCGACQCTKQLRASARRTGEEQQTRVFVTGRAKYSALCASVEACPACDLLQPIALLQFDLLFELSDKRESLNSLPVAAQQILAAARSGGVLCPPHLLPASIFFAATTSPPHQPGTSSTSSSSRAAPAWRTNCSRRFGPARASFAARSATAQCSLAHQH
jgi:hypothetical protein